MTAKYQLIVNSDNPAELAAILAALNSSTAPIATIAPLTVAGSNIVTADDDEDNSPSTPADANGVDSTGLPWDDRIHSTPAALTEKGVWRAKRGVGKDKAFVAQVEAELRARGQQTQTQQPVQTSAQAAYAGIPAPTFDPTQQPVQQMQPQQQFQQPMQTFDPNAQPQQQFQQMQPQQQFQQMQPQQPQTPAPTGPMDFNMFMQKIQQLLQQRDTAGNVWIDAAYLQGVSAQLGVAAITDLANNPAKINDAVNIMMQHGKWV